MKPTSPLELYKLLPKTNCRDCGLPSCMALASALLKEDARITACPHLDDEGREALETLAGQAPKAEGHHDTIEGLRARVRDMDLVTVARGLGARYIASACCGRLHVKCLGKDFVVRSDGRIESLCHVNTWVELMLLNYCVTGGAGALSGRWIAYGELPHAAPTAPYFERRCEEPLRALADAHPEVFLDLLGIFGATKAEGFGTDHALIIHPLPKVPLLILYTAPSEEGIESTLRILMDASVTTCVPRETLTYIGRGIVEMLKKILSKHRDCSSELLFM